MSGKALGIKTGALHERLQQRGDATILERPRLDAVRPALDRPEERAFGDLRGSEPVLESPHRAGLRLLASRNAYELPLCGRIRFRPPDGQYQALGLEGDIADLEGDDLTAA